MIFSGINFLFTLSSLQVLFIQDYREVNWSFFKAVRNSSCIGPFYDICSAGSIDPGNLWEGPISILLQSSEFLNLYEAFNCDIISLQFQPMKSSSKLETLLWVCIFTQKSQKLWLVGSDLGTLVLPFRQQTGEGYELFCSLLFDNILMQGFGVAITTRL